MKTQSKQIGAVLLGVSAMLAGCVATSPEAERNFGTSVRAAVAAQVADPAASANLTPVTGMDGRRRQGHPQALRGYLPQTA
ncbi:hypothetical protein LP419_18215 [Massilia sp. H-1]|nr:hypothetical protein LP419_18215 [Massilia sp. H-1]